jgi:hypothetical protein
MKESESGVLKTEESKSEVLCTDSTVLVVISVYLPVIPSYIHVPYHLKAVDEMRHRSVSLNL